MPQPIPLSEPDVGDAEVEAVVRVLRSGRLSIGPQLERFEQAVADRAGRRFGIGVNSGTSGLHLALLAAGIGPGDEVITTPFSFIATVNVILYVGARPVLVDIDPESLNLDPRRAGAAVTDRTRAILPVEVFGNLQHFPAYETLAERHGLVLIEDCCEALGGQIQGRPAGNFGQAGVFAFYPNKQITAGEGGVIVTDDRAVRDTCRSLRNQGRDGSDWLCHARMGYNYRLDEMSAALGRVQMQRLDEILQARQRVAEWYNQALSDVPGIHLPPMARQDPPPNSWFVYVVQLADGLGPEARDQVAESLGRAGIGCGKYFPPIHLQPYFQKISGYHPGDFPICEGIARRSLALPLSSKLRREQVQHVAAELTRAVQAVQAE
jgi:perosamine synthetase